jgi:hypothetical protein
MDAELALLTETAGTHPVTTPAASEANRGQLGAEQ